MARRALALLAISLVVLLVQAPGAVADAAAEGELCSDTATVSWETDLAALQVTGVFVEVIGCDDGEFVGIELLMDDGSQVPSEEPLGSEVEDEVAFFDVSGFDIGIEPVVGIRVYLVLHDVAIPVVTISVEQRFFNHAGSEQLGLRTVTELLVPVGGEYHVPSAGPGYTDIRCEDVGATSEELVNEGHGDFVAESSGVHLACYQQTPGTPGGPSIGPPGTDEPKVLPVAQSDLDAREEPATFDAVPARAETASVAVILAGLALGFLGAAVLRRRHRPE